MDLIRKIICLSLLAAVCVTAGAQKRVSADVEVKTAAKGKVGTVTKSVYCTSNGRLVAVYKTPIQYYYIANAKGETQMYTPSTNEVMSQYDKSLSSSTDLVMLFLSGHIDDLGLGYFGYRAGAPTRDGEYMKKNFTSTDPSSASVEIVYENYLPIYCAYTAPDGKLLSKKFLDKYERHGRLVLPTRITDISYGSGRDSTVTRTIYSGIKVDGDDPAFDFQVPADAKPKKPAGASK